MGNRSYAEEPTVDLQIRDATEDDALTIAPRLRQADLAEIKAHSGGSPQEALLHGLRVSSACKVVIHKHAPAAMFGIVPLGGILEETGFHEWPERAKHIDGAVWLLGTDDISIFNRQFLRWSKHWLDEVSKGHKVVGNIVDIRNYVHVRWLKWLGFKFIDEIRYGPEARLFHRFLKEV